MADRPAASASTTPDAAETAANLSGPAAPSTSGSAAAPSLSPASQVLSEIITEQERLFIERQPESARLAVEAREALAGGVTSSWQISRPQPVWLSHGSGSKLYDVDGHEYVDMHGGYRVSPARPAHPAIVAPAHRHATRP